MAESIRVACRIRPKHSGTPSLRIEGKKVELTVGHRHDAFLFDEIFGNEATQIDVFERVAKRAVEGVTEGFNGTVFAYGQTGSGKTHTMVGPSQLSDITTDVEHKGIIPRTADYLFSILERREDELSEDSFKYTVDVHYVQLYQEMWHDLLGSNKKLNLRTTTGLDAVREKVSSTVDVLKLLQRGWDSRRTAETNMNRASSRSHCIFVIEVTTEELLDDLVQRRTAKLNLVDLAGSERVAQTGVEAGSEQFKEGCSINGSLSFLSRVIRQVADRQNFVNYRDSQLTLFLKDSLGGNARTTVIVTVHPDVEFFSDTTSTLQFAQQCRRIQNRVNANSKLTGDSVLALVNKVNKLNQQLEAARADIAAELDADFEPVRLRAEECNQWKKICLEHNNEIELLRLQLRLEKEKNSGRTGLDQSVSSAREEARFREILSENQSQKNELGSLEVEDLRFQLSKTLFNEQSLQARLTAIENSSAASVFPGTWTPKSANKTVLTEGRRTPKSVTSKSHSKKRRTTMFAPADVVRRSTGRRLNFDDDSEENSIPEHLQYAHEMSEKMVEEGPTDEEENEHELEVEVSRLTQLVEQRDKEIIAVTADLNEEKKSVELQLKDSQDTVSELSFQLTAKKRELEKANGLSSYLQDKLTQTQLKLEREEGMKVELEQKLDERMVDLESANVAADVKTAEAHELRAQINVLEAELCSTRNNRDKLQNDADGLRRERDNSANTVSTLQSELDRLHAQNKEFGDEMRKRMDEAFLKEEEMRKECAFVVASSRREIESDWNEKVEMMKRLHQQEADTIRVARELAEEQKKEKEAKLREAEDRIAATEQKLSQIEDDLEIKADLVQRLEAALENEKRLGERTRAEQKENCENLLSRRTKEYDDEVKQLRATMELAEHHHEAAINKYRAKLDEVHKDYQEKEKRMTLDVTTKCDLQKAQLDSYRKDVDALEEKLVDMSNRAKDAEEKMTLAVETSRAAEIRTVELQDKKTWLEQRLAVSEEEVHGLRAEISTLGGHSNGRQKINTVSKFLKDKAIIREELLAYQSSLGAANKKLSSAGIAQVQVPRTASTARGPSPAPDSHSSSGVPPPPPSSSGPVSLSKAPRTARALAPSHEPAPTAGRSTRARTAAKKN